MNNEHIPSRLGERAFRTYEHYIQQILNRYPDVVDLTNQHTGFKNSTFAARLRDAMASFVKYRWKSSVNIELFTEKYKDIQVSERDGRIRAGSKAFLATPGESMIVLSPTPSGSGVQFDSPSREALAILCKLSSKQFLTRSIVITGLSAEDVDWANDNYDISLIQTKPNIYLLT